MEAFHLDLSMVKADDGLVTRNGMVVALTWSTYLVRPTPITTSTGSQRPTIYPGSTMNDNIWLLQIFHIGHMRVKSVILFGGSTVRGSHHRAGLPSTQDTTHDHHSGPDPQIDISSFYNKIRIWISRSFVKLWSLVVCAGFCRANMCATTLPSLLEHGCALPHLSLSKYVIVQCTMCTPPPSPI